MPKFASLFQTSQDAAQALDALRETDMGDQVDGQIVSPEDWNSKWTSDQGRGVPESIPASPRDLFLDMWMNQETLDYFSEGLKQGGAVLVVDVPDEFSRQAMKIVKENKGKLGD
jgi:hypothetical protein